MPRTISNTDNVIDSRDVIARIAELEAERDSFESDEDCAPVCASRVPFGECTCGRVDGLPVKWADENPDDAAELAALVALQDEAEGYAPDWRHGETLIRDSYFEDYARDLAEDIGAINRDIGWPACHIDWEAASDALKMDYTPVDFDGETYWVRS